MRKKFLAVFHAAALCGAEVTPCFGAGGLGWVVFGCLLVRGKAGGFLNPRSWISVFLLLLLPSFTRKSEIPLDFSGRLSSLWPPKIPSPLAPKRALRAPMLWVKESKPFWYRFGVGAPPILEPILVGIGMFTGGAIWMTHGHVAQSEDCPTGRGLQRLPKRPRRSGADRGPGPAGARSSEKWDGGTRWGGVGWVAWGVERSWLEYGRSKPPGSIHLRFRFVPSTLRSKTSNSNCKTAATWLSRHFFPST